MWAKVDLYRRDESILAHRTDFEISAGKSSCIQIRTISERVSLMHACNSRRRKILRTTSSNLVIDVNDFEIIVYSAIHYTIEQMK